MSAPPAALSLDTASRRRFLSIAGAGGASALALLLTACGDDPDSEGNATAPSSPTSPSTTTPTEAADPGDLDVMNFALTLEHIEAAFYVAVLKAGVVEDRAAVALFKEIGENEREHVEVLIASIRDLGGKPVAAPNTTFDAVIEKGAANVVKTAAVIENVGASAYLGQAGLIKDREILAAALSIHTVEARHAAAVNELAGLPFKTGKSLEGSVPDGPFAKPMTRAQVMPLVQPFLA